MPEDTKVSVEEIVANPAAYGFEWFTATVEKDGRKFEAAQLVRHIDVNLLRQTFGDAFFLEQANGTSRHVTNQRINRDLWWNALGESPSRKVTRDELRIAVVESMLGRKAARRRTVVVETKFWVMMPDGELKTFNSKEEAVAAYKAALAEQA